MLFMAIHYTRERILLVRLIRIDAVVMVNLSLLIIALSIGPI